MVDGRIEFIIPESKKILKPTKLKLRFDKKKKGKNLYKRRLGSFRKSLRF